MVLKQCRSEHWGAYIFNYDLLLNIYQEGLLDHMVVLVFSFLVVELIYICDHAHFKREMLKGIFVSLVEDIVEECSCCLGVFGNWLGRYNICMPMFAHKESTNALGHFFISNQ